MKNKKPLLELTEEKRGLLLIDGKYNTLLIPFESNEMDALTEYFIKDNLKYVRRNMKKSELNEAINQYLHCEYVNKKREV